MKHLFWIIPLFLLVISVSIMVTVYYTSPAHEVIDALINNNVNSAEYFYKSVEGNSIHETIYNSKLDDALIEINEKYNNKYTYNETELIYETIKKLNSESSIEPRYNEFTILYESKCSYQKGIDAFSEFDYIEAIEQFESVSEKDILYDNAINKKEESEKKHISYIKQEFYKLILEKDYNGAKQFITTSIDNYNSDIFIKLKNNINKHVYIKCNKMMSNLKAWEHIHQNHAGENDYYCYEIHQSNENPNYISCYYVLKRFYRQVLAGTLMPSGPMEWYNISGKFGELDYDNSKHLTNGKTIKWDYNASDLQKIEMLEELFS